ncbi:MAG: dephospho-CoA kinase [Clostridia bacterium]|nr:dephospho-CoA kinase [Clostridia bacterium]
MTQNNYLIAITGNIGSGKSTVLKTVKELGFPTLSLDEFTSAAYELQKDNLIKTFGKEIIVNGNVDRKALAKIVFDDKAKRKQLNELLHPVIFELAFNEAKEYPVCFVEVPLLFESGYTDRFDEVWLVVAPKSVLEERVIARDNMTKDEFKKRLSAQITDESKLNLAHYVIKNDGTIEDLKKQTTLLLKRFKN